MSARDLAGVTVTFLLAAALVAVIAALARTLSRGREATILDRRRRRRVLRDYRTLRDGRDGRRMDPDRYADAGVRR